MKLKLTNQLASGAAALGLAALGVAGVQSSASANGFLPRFSGYSEASNCAVCDSYISFAVWENMDGDWSDDLGLDPQGLIPQSDPDFGARYVYMYQFTNEDPVAPDGLLDSLGVAFSSVFLTSVGYFPNQVFLDPVGGPILGSGGGAFADVALDGSLAIPPLNAGTDDPNDGTPNLSGIVPAGFAFAGVPDTVYDPTVATIQVIDNPFVVDSPTQGVRFTNFVNPGGPIGGIPTGSTSSVMFITSNFAPTYRWAETEDGGLGASADVPAAVPEPLTILGAGTALGFGTFFKRKLKRKQDSDKA